MSPVNIFLDDGVVATLPKKPPACYQCAHWHYEAGSWCRRLKNEGQQIYNIVTGQTYDAGDVHPLRCHDQRFSTHPDSCGVEGKYFKQK